MITVTLTPAEIWLGEQVGKMRNERAFSNGWKSKGHTDDGANEYDRIEANHILGCHCEIATGKYCNLFWNVAVGEIGGIDLGGLVDVRGRRHPCGLRIDKSDDDALPFVDATAALPLIFLHGWCFGDEGKQPQWFRSISKGRGKCFWVPPGATVFRPMPELREYVSQRRKDLVA